MSRGDDRVTSGEWQVASDQSCMSLRMSPLGDSVYQRPHTIPVLQRAIDFDTECCIN